MKLRQNDMYVYKYSKTPKNIFPILHQLLVLNLNIVTAPFSETQSGPRRPDRARENGDVRTTSGARVTHYPRDHVDRTQSDEAQSPCNR